MVLDEPFPPDTRVENEAQTLLGAGMEVWLMAIAPDTRPTEEIFRGIRIIRKRIPKQVRQQDAGYGRHHTGTVEVR